MAALAMSANTRDAPSEPAPEGGESPREQAPEGGESPSEAVPEGGAGKLYPNCDPSVWLRSCEQEIDDPIEGELTGMLNDYFAPQNKRSDEKL